MSTPRTVFITGGTGFLGSFWVTFLLRKGYRVVALVRGPQPVDRLCEVLSVVDGDRGSEAIGREARLQVVEGDVRLPGLGLPADVYRQLAGEVEEIWHCATSFKFQERSREEITAHNVNGTHNVLDFARLCNSNKATPVFYVSTAYAAPVSQGIAREELTGPAAPARNLYEWSKQEAERLVETFRRDYHVPAAILRPSIILGHSQTGKAVRFTGYYDVIRAIYQLTHCLEVNLGRDFDRNLRLRILAQPDVFLNLVPIDFIVEAMWRLSRTERGDTLIFNLASDAPVPPLDTLFHYACMPLGVTGIELVGREAFTKRPMSGLERLFNRKTQFQAPYLLDGPRFDTTNFRRLVPPTELPCPPVDEQLLYKVNSYYYRNILDRQFQAQGAPIACSTPRVGETQGGLLETV